MKLQIKLQQQDIPLKKLQGFTLVELLVVIGIIIVLSGISLINYHSGEKIFALERSAQKVAEDLDNAKNLAMNSQEFEGQIPKGGYGVYFNLSFQRYYKLYADLDGNQEYTSSANEEVEDSSLEEGIFIESVSSSSLSVNFKPPDPLVTITGLDEADLNTATIVLCIENTDCSNSSNTKIIRINKTGLVEVE